MFNSRCIIDFCVEIENIIPERGRKPFNWLVINFANSGIENIIPERGRKPDTLFSTKFESYLRLKT